MKYLNQILLVLFLAAYCWFSFHLFPSYAKEMSAIANKEIQILDVRLTYDMGEVDTLMTDLKPKGRALYQKVAGYWDMIYPFVYGPLLALILFLLLKKSNLKKKGRFLLYLLPILAMCFDYLENFNILHMLEHHDAIDLQSVSYGATVTGLKWTFVLLTFMTVLILGGRLLWNRFR